MAIIQGQWNKLLAPGLAKDFEEYWTEIFEQDKKPYKIVHYRRKHGPPVRELHVVDLGEGMLVPCDLLRDLFGKS